RSRVHADATRFHGGMPSSEKAERSPEMLRAGPTSFFEGGEPLDQVPHFGGLKEEPHRRHCRNWIGDGGDVRALDRACFSRNIEFDRISFILEHDAAGGVAIFES